MALSKELKLQNTNQKFTLNAFMNALNVKGILEIQRTDLSEKAQKTFKKQFMETLKKDDVGIVDQLSKYHPIELNQDLAKFLRATDWTSDQIARAGWITEYTIRLIKLEEQNQIIFKRKERMTHD
ncbi:phage portal protein [Enterococcus faecalis]